MSTVFSNFFEKINKISPLNADFSLGLGSIAVMPEMLYYYGKLPEKSKNDGKIRTVAIVGTRHNSRYGEEVAYELAYNLARRGVVIVSGLAFGIDSIAHRAALDAGGVTVAFLGTPIDQIYPRAHEGLAREIVEKGGAVVSEYAPGEVTFPNTSFLQRNRLISGVSEAVVVVEAAERSGSLNTAMHALDQSRDLFVVPGDIKRPMSVGCNRLIKQGAMPYLGVKDFLDYMFPEASRRRRRKAGQGLIFGDTPEETQILACLAHDIVDGDVICETLKMEVALFNRAIAMMEIKGLVRGLGANRWLLV